MFCKEQRLVASAAPDLSPCAPCSLLGLQGFAVRGSVLLRAAEFFVDIVHSKFSFRVFPFHFDLYRTMSGFL